MKVITREEAAGKSEVYMIIFDTECHHDHEIVMDGDVLRWKANPTVRHLIDERIDLNYLINLFHQMGYGKNSEVYRKLYRDMGYSLSGYYDVFYWDANNAEYEQYKPTKTS